MGGRCRYFTLIRAGASDENIMLVIDNRLAMTVSVEEAERFVPFLADAIAVALGYGASARRRRTREAPSAPTRPYARRRGCGD